MNLPVRSSKNIVLIGCTAQGKSSLVREILKYGGKPDEAGSVKIGDGSLSQTQHCAMFDVEVGVKDHYLRTRATRGRIELTEETSHQDVVEDEDHLGRWMNLKIVDTPGFSDSGNTDSQGLKYSWKFGPDRMVDYSDEQARQRDDNGGFEAKDEMHKLKILRTMFKLETVHAICFVIRSNQPFSGQLQRILNALWTVLNASFHQYRSVSYHILHTDIGYRSRWTQLAINREREFSTAFPQFRGATHHFMDNLPISTNSIARHLAKAALARLFLSFSAASGASTKMILYPKVPEHEYHDRELRKGLKMLEESYGDDVADLRKRQAKCTLEKEQVSHKIQRLEANLETIKAQIKALDSDERIRFETKSRSAESGFWTSTESSKLVMTASDLSYPIRWVDWGEAELKKQGANWTVKKYSAYSLEATLQATTWLAGEVTGHIKLFTHKRDYRKKDLDEETATQARTKDELECQYTRRVVLAGDICVLEAQIANATNTKATFVADRTTMSRLAERQNQTGMLRVQPLIDRLHCLTVNSLYAAAAGYNLVSRVPKSKLPKTNLDSSINAHIASLNERTAEISDMLDALQPALSALKNEIRQTSELIAGLQKRYEIVKRIYGRQEVRTNKDRSLVLSNVPTNGVVEVEAERQRMQQEVDEVTAAVHCAAMSELELVGNHGNAILNTVKSLQQIKEKMKNTVAAWMIEIKWLELWKVASSITTGMIRGSDIGVGPFLVLKRAIEREERFPYAILCVDIWETLRAKALCDDGTE